MATLPPVGLALVTSARTLSLLSKSATTWSLSPWNFTSFFWVHRASMSLWAGCFESFSQPGHSHLSPGS